jgi:hemin uptake protein HemP
MPGPIHELFCQTGRVIVDEMPDPEQQLTDITPAYDANALTAGGRVARIHLNGQFYALRITRQGKLILTK